jgi:hypothetical protein
MDKKELKEKKNAKPPLKNLKEKRKLKQDKRDLKKSGSTLL